MTSDTVSTNEQEIVEGLQRNPKEISSKFLYDHRGEQLFREIMDLEEYYLTNCEMEILKEKSQDILESMPTKTFDIVELGAGDGSKTKHLIQKAVELGYDVRYVPIDIAQSAIDKLVETFSKSFPNVPIHPICGDYLQGISELHDGSDRSELILFLGSNIGNYDDYSAVGLLSDIRSAISSNDRLVVGFDLKKHPSVIHAAYNDSKGVTREFNLNFLHRCIREFDAKCDPAAFDHYESYDPVTGEAHSYLVSLKDQTIHFPNSDLTIELEKHELIHTEISRKYSRTDIAQIGMASGWNVDRHVFDPREWFADVVFTPRD